VKRPQTKFHTDTMSDSKVIRSKNVVPHLARKQFLMACRSSKFYISPLLWWTQKTYSLWLV